MLFLRFQAKPLVNAPLKFLLEQEVSEIEVTDPAHPLYGKRFAVAFVPNLQTTTKVVSVIYQDSLRLSIPLSATHLVPPRQTLKTKLTLESVSELITLVQQYEVLCPSPLVTYGGDCQPPSNK